MAMAGAVMSRTTLQRLRPLRLAPPGLPVQAAAAPAPRALVQKLLQPRQRPLAVATLLGASCTAGRQNPMVSTVPCLPPRSVKHGLQEVLCTCTKVCMTWASKLIHCCLLTWLGSGLPVHAKPLDNQSRKGSCGILCAGSGGIWGRRTPG